MNQEHQRIAMRAYQIWEDSGRPEGQALEHWGLASAELLRESGQTGSRQIGEDRSAGSGRDAFELIDSDVPMTGVRGRNLHPHRLRPGLTPTKRAMILARRNKKDAY